MEFVKLFEVLFVKQRPSGRKTNVPRSIMQPEDSLRRQSEAAVPSVPGLPRTIDRVLYLYCCGKSRISHLSSSLSLVD